VTHVGDSYEDIIKVSKDQGHIQQTELKDYTKQSEICILFTAICILYISVKKTF